MRAGVWVHGCIGVWVWVWVWMCNLEIGYASDEERRKVSLYVLKILHATLIATFSKSKVELLESS